MFFETKALQANWDPQRVGTQENDVVHFGNVSCTFLSSVVKLHQKPKLGTTDEQKAHLQAKDISVCSRSKL